MKSTPFDIPDQMREMADKNVSQAKKALEQYLDAAQKAVANVEGSAKSVQEGAAEVNRQTLAFLEENVAASFDLAQRLVQARTVEEIAALQKEYFTRQMANLNEQGKSLGTMMGRVRDEVADKVKGSGT
jgi:phasin